MTTEKQKIIDKLEKEFEAKLDIVYDECYDYNDGDGLKPPGYSTYVEDITYMQTRAQEIFNNIIESLYNNLEGEK